MASKEFMQTLKASVSASTRSIKPIWTEKIRGGIISLYAKMYVDSILRNKLFDKGKYVPAFSPINRVLISVLSRSPGEIDASS